MWATVPFNQLYAEPSRNGLNRPKRVRGEGYKMINMGELFAYDRINDQEMELVPMSDVEMQKFNVKPGDLLFARQSLVAAGTGKCSIVLDTPEITTFESHLIRVRLDQNKTDPRFYYYYFSSPAGRGNVQSLVMQVAAAGIRASELTNLRVPHPPLPTQRRIAAILSAYDDLIENNTRRIKILEVMAQLLYREWFVHFRFPGHERVKMKNGVPEGWEKVKVSEVAALFRGRSYRGEDLTDNGGLPFLNLKCIERNGGFRHDGLKRYRGVYKDTQTARAGDIVMAVTDMTQEKRLVARTARVPKTDEDLFVMSMDLVKVSPNADIPKAYLYTMLRFSNFPDEVKQHANGVNVLHLNPERIAKFEFALPPPPLRKQLGETCSNIYEQCDLLNRKNANLRRTRDLLLPRLVSGEVDVEEIDIATAYDSR